jgi:hypothetical protein
LLSEALDDRFLPGNFFLADDRFLRADFHSQVGDLGLEASGLFVGCPFPQGDLLDEFPSLLGQLVFAHRCVRHLLCLRL